MDKHDELTQCLFVFKGKNTIVIVSGANDLLNEASVSKAENFIRSAKVMVCQLEISPKTTLAAMTLAKKHGGEASI